MPLGTECFSPFSKPMPTAIPLRSPWIGEPMGMWHLWTRENIRRGHLSCIGEYGPLSRELPSRAGAGQNEIDFRFAGGSDCRRSYDHLSDGGKAVPWATAFMRLFLPKPLAGDSGNGLHQSFPVAVGKKYCQRAPSHCRKRRSFIQGILNWVREITVFLNPLVNSYARFGSFEAPRYLTWSHQNRSQLIRIPVSFGGGQPHGTALRRSVLQSLSSLCASASCGSGGIEQKVALEPPCKPSLPEEEGRGAAVPSARSG